MTTEYEKKLEEFIEDIKSWRSKLNPDKCFSVNQVEYLSEWGKDIFDLGYRKAREEIKEKLEILYLKTCELEELNPEEWNECETLSINSILKELGLSEDEPKIFHCDICNEDYFKDYPCKCYKEKIKELGLSEEEKSQ